MMNFAGFDKPSFSSMSNPRQDLSNQMTDQTQKKPWWTSLISEAGGAGGLAAGAALAPETGGLSLLIPAIGAAVGAFGGRVAENKVRDNRLGLGDAAKEAAVSGGLSLAGEGYNAFKGAKAGLGVAEAVPKVGFLEGIGKNIKAGGMGLAQGASAPGIESIGARQSDSLLNTLNKTLKIKAGSPEAVQRALEPRLSNIGQKIASQYAKSNVALSTEELNSLGSKVLQRVTTEGGLSGSAAQKYALDEAQRLVNTNDVAGLWKYTQDLEKNSINFARGAASASPAKESVARIIREEARGFLNDKVPGLSELNNVYHNALDANKLLIKASKNPTGGGLIGKVGSLSPVKAAEAKTGNLLENIGKLSAGTGGNVSKFTNALKIQSPGSLLRGVGGAQQQSQNPQSLLNTSDGSTTQSNTSNIPNNLLSTSGDQTTNLLGQANGDVTSQLLGQAAPQQSGGPSLESLQKAIEEDIQNSGGKGIPNLMQLAQLYGLVDSQGLPVNSSGGKSNVGKVSAASYGLAQQGTKALGQLSQLVQNDPSVVNRTATPGRGLPIVGGLLGNISKTSEYDTLGFAAVSSLLRAQSGAAVPDSEVRSYMRAYLPRPGDSQDVIKRKLDTLQYDFATVLNAGEQGVSSNSSSDLLSQLNGQGI